MSTSTSAVFLQRSSPARGAAQYPPSRDFDLASKLDVFIQASEFSKAVDFLIFSLGQTDLTYEKEAIFKYLFILLPRHDEKQYTQLCERLPRLLEVARDDPHKQSRLAQQLAERFMALTKELPLEQRIEYFISAQHFIAKAMKMETNPTAIKKCHQTASKHFITLIFELLVKNRAFQTMIDEARRKVQVDRLRAHVRKLEDLMRLCCDEEDHQLITTLHSQAIEVANAKNDELQACFAPIFARVGQPFSLPVSFSTERYQIALQTFRLQFVPLDPAMDIRVAQKHRFTAFRTFFKVLIDDILVIMGPPPCGFDLRAMGSIGREEICPFSDLECMILIAEDNATVRKYFSLFVQILEMQMASFGETPGAIPFAFTCLHPPEMKGLYLDLSPRKDDRLIATPVAMAAMQKERSLEGPTCIQHTVLRTSSLYTTDPTLHNTYQEESQRVIDACPEDPLKQRALQHIEIRKKDYQRIWQTLFSSAVEKIELKTQFIEPFFHLLGDLALYDHIQATNTLDIIDALKGRFNADSLTFLKEAVSFLYTLRIDVQRLYSEQREDVYFPPCQTLQRIFIANQSIINFLEKIFYLIIFPLYHVPELTAIHSLDLVDVAMTQALSDPFYTQNPKLLIPLVRQAALFLESTHVPTERYAHYYRKIGELSKGEILQQTYINALKDSSLRALLAKQSNSAGFRQEKRLREEALFASVQAITTPHPVEGMQVQVTIPCIKGLRYLHPAAIEQIIDGRGRIISSYESKHRVTSLVWQEHKLHFKMWPSHPLMEYALYDLYYRIAGQLSPANILACFTAVQDDKTIHYPVLISETIDHPTLSKKAAAGDPFSNIDVKQWSWLILCAILTRTGDGRLSNYVMSNLGKIYAVDNDIAFVFPTQENLFFSKINFACVLFFLSQHPLALDPEILKEFLSLDFDLILSSWLEEMIAKEKEYNSLFNEEGKPVVLEVPATDLRSREKDSFTSSILFPPGAIIACRLQAARLKNAIIRAQKSTSPVSCFDLLKEFVSLRTDLPLETKVGERVFQAYTAAQKQPTVAERYAAAIGRKAASSLTLAEFQRASFQNPPSQREIEASAFSPSQAYKELLAVIEHADGKVSYSTSITGEIVLQGHFAHLRSSAGPNFMRQKLVLKYVTHLLESSAVKPTCVILRDCDVLNRSHLLPFFHPNVKILDLRNSPQIFSRSLVDIANQCSQLEELFLCRANISAFPPTMTFPIVQFPRLRILQITESPRLTSLQINAPGLEYLNLSSNPQLKTLYLIARSFPKIVFKNSPMVPWLPIGDLRKMLSSDSELCNAVKFYREIFRNLIGDEHVLIPNGDDIIYFEAIEEHGSSLLESSKKLKETTRQQLLAAACSLRTKLIERLADVFFPSLPPLEREWLYICAYLNPNTIPTYFLDEWLKSEHPGENVLVIRDGILASLSTNQAFLRHDSSTETYSIPRLFQEILKDKDRHSSYAKACHLLIRLWNQIDFDDIRDWKWVSSKAEELFIHSDLLMADPQFKVLSSEDQAKFYSKMGEAKYIRGKFREALEKHERALVIRQKALDPNQLDIARSLSNIGCCLEAQGKYQEALEKHERALEIRQEFLDPNHQDIAKSLNNVGNCLQSQGKYQLALALHQKALEIQRKTLDSNHPDIAKSLSGIGDCLYSQGKYQEALEKFEEALEIRRISLDPNHPDIASNLNNIGGCLQFQGEYVKALMRHQWAREIQRESLPFDHPDIAASISNIGLCLADSRPLFGLKTEDICREALEIRQKALDPNHPDIAISLSDIGYCLYSQGKYREALNISRRALEIRQKALAPDHPDIAISLMDIGDCLYSQGKYQKALEEYERALEIRRKSLDPNHLDIAASLHGIGLCLRFQGKNLEALAHFGEALEIRRKTLDSDHPDIVASLQNVEALQ